MGWECLREGDGAALDCAPLRRDGTGGRRRCSRRRGRFEDGGRGRRERAAPLPRVRGSGYMRGRGRRWERTSRRCAAAGYLINLVRGAQEGARGEESGKKKHRFCYAGQRVERRSRSKTSNGSECLATSRFTPRNSELAHRDFVLPDQSLDIEPECLARMCWPPKQPKS